MSGDSPNGARPLPWVEILLGVALATLALQVVFPAAWLGILQSVDPRHWSWGGRFLGTLVLLLILLGFQFTPTLKENFQARQEGKNAEREKAQRVREARDRKQRIQGIRESRNRRQY